MTIGSKTYEFTVGSTTISAITVAVAAAWNALSATLYPEFAEITASSSATTIILTADTPGRPFTITVTTVELGGGASDSQTVTPAATTANSGPYNWDTAANWSTGAVPVDGDSVRIDSGSDIRYGFPGATIEPASITILQSYTGKIGLLPTNKDASTQYPEYRPQYLLVGPVLLTIGEGPGDGSGRIKIDTGTDPVVVRILNTGQSEDPARGAVILKGSEATNQYHIQNGYVELAPYLGEDADVSVLTVANDAVVNVGSGVTLTDSTITQSGGSLTLNSASSGTSPITLNEGTLTLNGTGGHVDLTVRGGTCVYNSTGTLGGNPRVEGRGHLDFSQDLRSRAVTNPIEVFGENAKVSDPYKTVATLVLDLNGTENNANLRIGRNIRVTRGTPS